MKRSAPLWFLAIALPLGAAIFWLLRTSRAATETPKYQVIATDGDFEIRDYPALTLASTPVDGLGGTGMNGAFGQLFRFITGSNSSGAKISMTTPVLINATSNERKMSFIMPPEAAARGIPRPAGSAVTLRRLQASRFAVLRFTGAQEAAPADAAIQALKRWMTEQKIASAGDPIVAFYDPPWTPAFLQRNEVMLRIAPLTGE